jgi:putative endonuclease
MAYVYILYSIQLNKHYIGSCINLEQRIEQHQKKSFKDAFTTKTDDWQLIFSLNNLGYEQARKIEAHIKKMKSVKYIRDLVKYKEISEKLMQLYNN